MQHQVIDNRNGVEANQSHTFLRIMKYFTKKGIYWTAIIFTIIVGASPVAMNIIMGNLVTDITSVTDKTIEDIVAKICVQLVIYYVAFCVGCVITDITTGFTGPFFLIDIRTALYKKLMALDISFFDLNNTGSLLNKFTSDCAVLNEVYISKTFRILADTAKAISGLVVALIYSWQARLACFIGFPLCVLCHFISQHFIKKLWDEFNNSTTDANAKAEQAISSFRTVKSFDNEIYETSQFKKSLNIIERIYNKCAVAIGIKDGLLLFIINCMLIGFLYFISWIIIERPGWGTKNGDLMIVVSSIIFTTTGIVSSLTLIDDFMRAKSSAKKVLSILETPVFVNQREGEYPDEPLTGKIEFKDVCFKYQTNDQYAVKDLSFTVNPGETVALIGESGCGKSTTLQLLQRFYEIESGEILVDGKDIRKLSPHYLRSQISIVPQGPVLFSMSIKDNIRYAKPKATDKEVSEAAEIGNAHSFIMSFPENYNTNVNPVSLSGGQKQRICISRAILTNSPILLLDEATAALDTESERLVQQSLEKVRKGKTAIVVAHRLATVINSDRILVFKDGSIVEEGKHADLLAKNGYYADLIKYQLQ